MILPTTDVAVCIVQAGDGSVLLAQRTARQIAAGFWELPGGKIEPGETPAAAAARELHEETGLTPIGLTEFMQYEHLFPSKRLKLHFFQADGWEGTPQGREGQRLAWVAPQSPQVGPVLPSNDRALFALGLPENYIVANFAAGDSQNDFLGRLHGKLADGNELIRIRLSASAPGQKSSLLARAAATAAAFPRANLLAGSVMDASRAGLAGVHSCTRELRRLTSRPPVRVWAATCHDQADLLRAKSLGADFVVLSPVVADPQRPHEAAIGWDGLRRLAATFPARVYATGGLDHAHTAAARQAGAAGVVVNA